VLLGRDGEMFVVLAVMMSTYAWLSGAILNLPRLACSFASGGDFPSFLGRLHARFNTPATAIVLFSAIVWVLAATGTFLWAAALSGGATVIIYTGMCAALIRLRQKQPHVDAIRIPFGRTLAIIGILISMTLLTQLRAREALLMGVTGLIATLNWWWAKRREVQRQKVSGAVVAVAAVSD
jgi:basic amino acid/polyamine antiporter, APA family